MFFISRQLEMRQFMQKSVFQMMWSRPMYDIKKKKYKISFT